MTTAPADRKAAERQAAERKRKSTERQRRKTAGLVRVEVYVKPEDRQAIRDLADKLTKRPKHST